MNKIVESLRENLRNASDLTYLPSFQRFFKNPVKAYCIRSQKIKEISNIYRGDIKKMSKVEAFELCEELYKSGYEEEAWIAAGWSFEKLAQFSRDDFEVFENWINKYIDDWAKCDGFCCGTVGHFIEKYPEYISQLKVWAKSKNLWLRRASAVSMIVVARKGLYLKEVFEIAEILLLDKEDMVQKGYGWMLKVASGKHEKAVFDFVVKHRKVMPRTALRYAIEKMPVELKKEAMKKEY